MDFLGVAAVAHRFDLSQDDIEKYRAGWCTRKFAGAWMVRSAKRYLCQILNKTVGGKG